MNLNSEVPVSKDLLNVDRVSPWLHDVLGDFDFYKNESLINGINDVYYNLSKAFNYNNWITIKKCWRFYLKGNKKLLEKFLSDYDFKENIEDNNFLEYLYDFILTFFLPGKKGLYENCLELLKNCKLKYFNELIYYKTQELGVFKDFIKKGKSIFTEYFSNYNLYEPVLLYLKNNVEIREELIVTTVNFEKIKMFYRNCFEYFTDIIEILTCLNNISNGRAYNEFEKMNLGKYRSLDKAGKLNPLKNNSFYQEFNNKFNNQLRNASHHGSIEYNEELNLIKYIHGKGKTESFMSYLEYLEYCNEIFLNTCVVLSISMIIFYR